MTTTISRLRVAAIQMTCVPGDFQGNAARAETWLSQAAGQRAQLALLPELALSGYKLTPAIWDYAEPAHGHSVAWLLRAARRFGLWLGTTFVESDGRDIYNTFVLAAPNGEEAGRVRKTRAETAFFKPHINDHIILTPLGRVGVGVCADNHFTFFPPLMRAQSADLVLAPHAWAAPFRVSRLIEQADIDSARRNARDSAPLLARALGVPAIFTNMTGPIQPERWAGLITGAMGNGDFHFHGMSTIADSDGSIAATLDQQEGVIIAEVTLDPARKHYTPPPAYGQMLFPGNPLGRALLRYDEWSCGLSYRFSRARKEKARQAATASAGPA